MDSAEAQVFAQSLVALGSVAGWKLVRLLSYGKSAVLMQGQKNETVAAVKIFHPGLIEKYGLEAQQIRVNRERELIQRHHPNIVQIIEAGSCDVSGHLYVAMEIVAGQPLSKLISSVPRKNITKLVEQLARAAKQLEDWGFTHRDIKPDNIHIVDDDLSLLKLLDFGVMKPHGDDAATSQQASKAFIGTHQYSPPEMIHGREDETLDGWRAITFYQIGAVLHDLITRKPIFEYATSRHADLVAAIDGDKLVVTADDVDPTLGNLATRCLLKKPAERLELVGWADFLFSERAESPSIEDRKNALLRQMKLAGTLNRVDAIEEAEARRLKDDKLAALIRAARSQFDQAIASLSELLPPRTTELSGEPFPAASITYTFIAAPDKGVPSPFRIQLAVAPHTDRSTVDVHVRASKGLADTEAGWIHLTAALESLDGTDKAFETWMLTILEELVRH